MAITAPYSLTATMASSSRINLAWANADVWSSVKIERKAAGGSFAQIASVSGSTTSYSDTSCQDGTLYYYRVRAYEGTPLFEYSAYSSEANATTKLDAPTGLSGSATSTTVDLEWNDNCQNESGFKIYKNGAYLDTVGANVKTYEATGLTPGTWYTFTVKAYNAATTSAASNSELIWTADPPAKPSDLVATATGTTTATLNWTDNADNEVDQKVERSSTSASAGFSLIATVNANVTTYADSGLVSNTQYWYRVRSHNASGYSAYCTVATAVTWAAIAAPTNLTAEAFSGTEVDIRFTDNSELEDFHCVERKTGAGAYSEIVQLEPNRTFYRDSGLSSANTYTYKVRAKQGASTYSSYSGEAAATPLAVLAAPADLTVSEYQDTWARLTWSKVAGATGYRIAQSTPAEASYAIIATVAGDVGYFKPTGLTAGIKYYWKVLTYNGAGNGSYSASVNQTTRAAYLPSKFEKLIRKS